jgi:hypothetical protein
MASLFVEQLQLFYLVFRSACDTAAVIVAAPCQAALAALLGFVYYTVLIVNSGLTSACDTKEKELAGHTIPQ